MHRVGHIVCGLADERAQRDGGERDDRGDEERHPSARCSSRGRLQSLGLSCVQFVGAVPHDEVPDYVAAADVCVAAFASNPVTQCKSPLKLAEYLASGKAVVASDVGEVRRMVGEAGVMVRPGDAQEMAEEIVRLLRDPEERQRLGRLARERVMAGLTWMHTARRLVEAYEAGRRGR